MQRLLDILFSGLALLVLSPLLLPIMLVLRLSGEGEVFYVQRRVGRPVQVRHHAEEQPQPGHRYGNGEG